MLFDVTECKGPQFSDVFWRSGMALPVVRRDSRYSGKLAKPSSYVAHRQVLDTDPQPQLSSSLSG